MLVILLSTQVWSGIWSVATTKVSCWTWIWPIRKWLLDLNFGKTQLVAIDVKIDGHILDKQLSFKMLWLLFSSKLDWGSYIISVAKTAFKKNGALIHSMKFLSPEIALYLYQTSIPTSFPWNTVVISGLVLLVATWKCLISYKNGYLELTVLHLQPFWNPWPMLHPDVLYHLNGMNAQKRAKKVLVTFFSYIYFT